MRDIKKFKAYFGKFFKGKLPDDEINITAYSLKPLPGRNKNNYQ
jgi:hypothetical protein